MIFYFKILLGQSCAKSPLKPQINENLTKQVKLLMLEIRFNGADI